MVQELPPVRRKRPKVAPVGSDIEALLLQTGVPPPPPPPPELGEGEFIPQVLPEVVPQDKDLSIIFQQVYPEFDFGTETGGIVLQMLVQFAEEDPTTFIRDIQDRGRNEATEALLRTLGAQEQDIEDIFADVTKPEEEPIARPFPGGIETIVAPVNGVRKVITVTPSGRAFDSEGNFLGVYNTVTKEFEDLTFGEQVSDTWDAGVLAAAGAWSRTKGFFLSTVPNLLFRDMSDLERNITGDEWADETNIKNQQTRDFFRGKYAENNSEYEEWLKTNNIEIRPDYLAGVTKNTDLIKDPFYWAYEFANIVPYAVASMSAGLVAGMASGGNPLVAIAAAGGVFLPSETEAVRQELLLNGMPEEQADLVALAAGSLIASLEGLGRLPLLKAVSPQLLRLFRKEASEELARLTMRDLLKKGVRVFTATEISETLTEVLQEAVGNAAVKIANEEQSIFEGLEVIAAKTAIGTAPLSLLGGGASMRRVSPSETKGQSRKELETKGFVEDEGNWYEPVEGLPAEVPVEEVTKAPPVIGEVSTEQLWNSLDASDRAALARQAGLEGTFGTKEWADLTKEEQGAVLLTREELIPARIEPVVAPEVTEVQIPQAPKGEVVSSELIAEVNSITKTEFVERNQDLVIKEKGRFGTTHFALKTRKHDYQLAGQVIGGTQNEVLEKLYDRLSQLTQPTVALEVPQVTPVKGVATEATDIAETMTPEVIAEPTPVTTDATINVHDLNVIDRFRPTRFVFEKMGLFDIWEDAFRAETLRNEEQIAFNKELKRQAKAVDKEAKKIGVSRESRRELMWEFVNNNNQEVFNQLTFPEKEAALWWKRTADDWANRLNIPQERRIKDYIPHIFDEAAKEAQDSPVDASFSMLFSKNIKDKVKMPFLEKRLGKELGLVKDPFLAAQAYQNVALRKFYYEPILQKLKLVSEHETTPEFARNYLKDYSRRMTGEPALIDREANKFLIDVAKEIRNIPGAGKVGESLAGFLERGNATGMAAYNLTSALYVMWLGFKPTTAIRNLSQHGLIIAEVDSILDFAEGIRLRFTSEGRAAIDESLVWRSRRGAFVESIDSSMASRWTDTVRESALFLFRKADEQNVKDAFLSGYAEAKRLFPEQDRQVWIDRGDEVAADTQYLYTKMNSLAISQSGPGKVGAMLTTWGINWLELMNKFARGRGSRVYRKIAEDPTIIFTKDQSGAFSLPKRNWLKRRQSIIAYMTIVGLAYALKEQDWNRLKAFEYTGFTSIRTFANLVGGEFPALQLPGAVADLITGITLGDERRRNTAWNELKRSFSILNQVERVASGEKDWLSLLFYLEGKNFQVRQLKEDWEDNWKPYDDLTDLTVRSEKFPTLSLNTAQRKWREQNPKIEAQMFVTNRLGTLSSEEARQEVLRLIEKHDIDTEVINGYDKVFGVDTTEELDAFQKRIGSLEKFTIGEEAKYFTVGSFLTELNSIVKTQGRAKVERDGQAFSIFLLGEQDSWQPYEDYDPKTGARLLYRQLNPDVEASLYLAGKIGAFENPESAKILLQIMDKYNIPPQSVSAFNENPDKYDELFTPKFELEQKNFELTTEYENFANSEATNFIEDKEERKLAREKFKEDNPKWVADQRRIEAIDNDGTPAQIEKWVERGVVIDKFNPIGSEAQAWLLDNPDVHKWALDKELLTDDGADWNEDLIRLQVKWRETDETYDELSTEGNVRDKFKLTHSEWNDDLRRRTMFSLDASDELVETLVGYGHVIDQFSSGSSQAKIFRLDNPELDAFGTNEDTLGWEELDKKDEPIWRIDVRFEKEDNEYQAILDRIEDSIKQTKATDAYFLEHSEYHKKRFERDALRLKFSRVDEYVMWHTDTKIQRSSDLDKDLPFYEDDWFLMEHIEFYNAMLKAEIFTKRRDFRLVPMKNGKPDRVVGRKYVEYLLIKNNQAARDGMRVDNPDLDEWGVSVGIWTRTMSERRRRFEQTASERFAEEFQETQEDVEKAQEERRKQLEEIEKSLRELG